MSGFNGSGIYERFYSWVVQATVNDGVISATEMDEEFDGIATALSNCVTRDGQSPALNNINLGGYRFLNSGDALLENQYVTLKQIRNSDKIYYVTTGSANAYILTPNPVITAYVTGQSWLIKANFANTTTTPSININSVGARTLTDAQGNALKASAIVSGGFYIIVYDGTNFRVLNPTQFDLTGNLVGNVTGNVTGNLTGNVTGNITGNSTGTHTGAVVGNATTATTLQTARTINGVSFNGSSNITINPNVTRDDTTNANRYIAFFDDDGIYPVKIDANLTYNPSLNRIYSNLQGNVIGNVTGSITGNVTGNVDGDVTGNLTGNTNGVHTGNASGTSLTYTTVNATNLNVSGTAIATYVDNRVNQNAGVASAWCTFNGVGSVSITNDFNIASITDNGIGDYTLNFSTAMTDANYAVSITTNSVAGVNQIVSATTTALRIKTLQFDGDNFFATDLSKICVTIFG